MNNNSLEEIRSLIDSHENIILSGHLNPDGDAIGSTLGLATSLKLKGKNVKVLLEDYYGKYDAIPNKDLIVDPESIDKVELFISLDCGDIYRLSYIEEIYKKAEVTLNIDHHKSNDLFGDYNYVFPNSSSTCEIVYGVIDNYYPMDKDIATALYAGLIFDTGGFRHSSTSPETMRIASELLKMEIPFNEIYIKFFDTKNFSEVKIMSKALDNTKLMHNDEFIYTTLTKAEIQEIGGAYNELDGIINYIKGVENVKVSCFFYEKEKEDTVKVGFRSDDGYDVSEFAKRFGGGGHIKASGCTLDMTIDEAVKLIAEEIKSIL